MTKSTLAAEQALRAYALGKHSTLSALGNGLINETFAVECEAGSYVLQRVHSVFSPQIHHNIQAVTERLHARAEATPQLVRTRNGQLWTEQDTGVWRVMTRLPGVSFDAANGAAQAHVAAGALARFHLALVDLEHTFVGMRASVHDTPLHLENLRTALRDHADHRLFGEVEALASALLQGAQRLPNLDEMPARVVHGDPKFNNLLFEQGRSTAQPVGWVDLDTVGPMPLHLELGDAWRSWCNPRGEDEAEAVFDLDVFAGSLAGYAEVAGSFVTCAEQEALLHGVEWITLELASRFCADALQERYFGWDSTRFESRGTHNLRRALGQWSLHLRVLETRTARAALIRSAFAGQRDLSPQ